MDEWMNAYVHAQDQYFRSLRQMLRLARLHPLPPHFPPYFTPEETGDLDSKDISTATWLGCAVGEVTSPLKRNHAMLCFHGRFATQYMGIKPRPDRPITLKPEKSLHHLQSKINSGSLTQSF